MPDRADARAAALVLGLDSHGLAIVRALVDAGVPTFAVEKDLSIPGVASNRPQRVFPVASFDEAALLPALTEIRRALRPYRRVALLAVNDRQVGILARHREALAAEYDIAWAHAAESILKLQRKSELEAHCLQQGLRYPRSAVFAKPDDAAQAASFRFPVIIKPVQPLSSFKTLIANDAGQLADLLRRQAHDMPILGQEYISGDDSQIYFGALMLDHGRVLGRMAGRKLESYPLGRGQTTIAETVHAPEVLQLTERFFAGLDLSGPVSLELKRDPQGEHWVIEPTVGRTDFWAQLCIGAGFNQPLMEFQLATQQPVATPGPLRDCVWYDSERDPRAFPRLAWRHKSFRPLAKRQLFCYWGYGDLRSFLRAMREMIQMRIRLAFSGR